MIDKRSIFLYELAGMIFIIFFGSILHFTFEWSGNHVIVGIFSAVNESVWEHMKLGFWPAILYLIIEYLILFKKTNNFFLAKTAGIYTTILIIPLIFYSYTAFTGEDIFVIDILSFVLAVIIGQLISYKLLTFRKLSKNLQIISIISLAILGFAFIIFTFFPPKIPLFQDPISGKYGIINHLH